MQLPHLTAFVEANGIVFVSGQLAFDSQARIPHEDIEGQTTLALKNLAVALAGAGLALKDVVKTTVWLRDARDFPVFNSVYANVFGELRPARSTVVGQLVHPDALVEIEAVAARASLNNT
jgi:2-iminobutanoate/2-iminopropanoate deaminase